MQAAHRVRHVGVLDQIAEGDPVGEGRQGVERQAEEQRERHPGAGVVDIVDIVDITDISRYLPGAGARALQEENRAEEYCDGGEVAGLVAGEAVEVVDDHPDEVILISIIYVADVNDT